MNPGNIGRIQPVRFRSTPGHIEIEGTAETEDFVQAQMDFTRRPTDSDKPRREIRLHATCAKRITKVPMENWEESYGEPYYPQVRASSLNTSASGHTKMDEKVVGVKDEDEDDEDEERRMRR
ncbi:hypothetical protein EG329_006095 [Mollisiaceae sp. DMI_Dod_QoI]|nr:hypothetical protein EG329_006095 [Helotiales sp. DMI_Dod_QoI]